MLKKIDKHQSDFRVGSYDRLMSERDSFAHLLNKIIENELK